MNLVAGDQVVIIAPASQLRGADRHLLARAAEQLQSWGLSVRPLVGESHHFYLAGPDCVRAGHLRTAMESSAKAVFCLRGGYGSARLVPYLSIIEPKPKILVGFSDISALHLAIRSRWPQIDLIHGPNVATHQFLGDSPAAEATRLSLYNALFRSGSVEDTVAYLRPGKARGRLIGGCLSMVVSMLGTKCVPRTRNAVLFLEDIGEAPFRIDRMLTQMMNAGLFRDVKGVVFGEMKNCNDPYNDLRAVLTDLFRDVDYPVAFGLRSGHGDVNLSLRLGCWAELDSEKSLFRLDGSPRR